MTLLLGNEESKKEQSYARAKPGLNGLEVKARPTAVTRRVPPPSPGEQYDKRKEKDGSAVHGAFRRS